MALGEYLWAGSSISKAIYHLNWNSNDSSGNGNNWTDTSITYVNWRVWTQSASFNGTTSAITLPDTLMNWTTAGTLLFWFKRATTGNQHTLIDKSQIGVVNYFQLTLQPTGADQNKLRWISFGWWTIFSTSAITDTTDWHNGWITFDWTNVNFYIDWVLDRTVWYTFWVPATNRTPYIWKIDTNIWYMEWLIDEVIIENRAWSAVEIKRYYTFSKWRY